jgi:hypothetical protein
MTQTSEDRALLDLNNAFNELCPKENQGAVWVLIANMKADGTHDKRKQAQSACSMLYDGLAYGNWPKGRV